jgi:hypothetical protein
MRITMPCSCVKQRYPKEQPRATQAVRQVILRNELAYPIRNRHFSDFVPGIFLRSKAD